MFILLCSLFRPSEPERYGMRLLCYKVHCPCRVVEEMESKKIILIHTHDVYLHGSYIDQHASQLDYDYNIRHA